MNIHNPIFNSSNLLVSTDTYSYYRSNNHLKFSERIHLLCKTIFQTFLNLFFNYFKKDLLQSQWREIFWGQKVIIVSNFNPTHSESVMSLSSPSQISCFAPPPPILSFQDNTYLKISSSQKTLLMEKSPYFKILWSGNFRETLQNPLALTQKEFTHLLNCLMNANFKVPLQKIPSLIQLADYYQLTEIVKNLEKQLIAECKLKKYELFNSREDSLVELKKLLNFAHQYQLNTLKNYLELTVVSSLLNQTSHLTEFEKILNHFPNEIEELNFSKNTSLTNAHLLALKNCKNLKVLHLQECRNLTDAGLAYLTPLTALQHLNLAGCKFANAGLAHLTPLVALQHLNLSHCRNITDAGLAHLTHLVTLKYLNLGHCKNITDAGLAHLTPLMALQHLNLGHCSNFTDAGLAHLTPLLTLTHLNLSWCYNFTDAGLAHLTPLVALQHLNLGHCRNITDAGLAHLTPLVALTHLNLSWCYNFTDAGLAHLTPLMALQHLDLSSCFNLTDAGLAHLTPLVTLQHLDLSYCRNLTDAGLAHLTPLVALTHLNLSSYNHLTDAGLTHLKPLLALTHLNLSSCNHLTDAGLTHLSPLLALQDLNLSYCENFTDAGLAHFKSLSAFPNLNLIWYQSCINLED
ncbi:leucine-rich repeat domain-containing protein [Candidatus Protochlamydia sp. W-9]|uniref:leucine-rich repeat domain-containing protein n=1 Tax=Candidatus Protochlamydia sp. W-9 TaxID=1785087 RepID=UPI00096A8236|nr:BTB/POZ domain-containing protein [Candidatus Protochlamydia sp. W-9]